MEIKTWAGESGTALEMCFILTIMKSFFLLTKTINKSIEDKNCQSFNFEDIFMSSNGCVIFYT